MKLIVEFPDGDTKVSEILDILIPKERLNSFMEQLEDPINSLSVEIQTYEECFYKLREVAALCSNLPNHDGNCAALYLRDGSKCDCIFGKLRKLSGLKGIK